MSIIDAVILGIVQGLTEFLPVSSSGHLVVFQNFLGFKEPMIAFDIAMHWGTLLAVVIYFRKELLEVIWDTLNYVIKVPVVNDRESLISDYPAAIVGGLIILASIPTAIIGIFFKDFFQILYHSVIAVSVAWLIMGVLLVLSRKIENGNRELFLINTKDAFLIGLVQGIAIIPGISRSGSTILMSMYCGIERKEAAKFSFLISVPAILGAGLLQFDEGIVFADVGMAALAAGFFSSAIVGYAAVAWLIKLVSKGRLHVFGYYCIFAAVGTMIYHFIQA